jgi:hypothetical protein
MAESPRYRTENGETVIDVKLGTIEHLFDNRDPAPFRERDLDPQLVEYLIDAGEDVVTHDRVRGVFWFERPCSPHEVEAAYRGHFAYELARNDRVRRRHRRAGLVTLAIAIVSIVVLVSLSEVVASVIGGSIGAGLKEGLVISGWVLMWRPIEVLVYDAIPSRRKRRVLRKLLAMPLDVRSGERPPA